MGNPILQLPDYENRHKNNQTGNGPNPKPPSFENVLVEHKLPLRSLKIIPAWLLQEALFGCAQKNHWSLGCPKVEEIVSLSLGERVGVRASLFSVASLRLSIVIRFIQNTHFLIIRLRHRSNLEILPFVEVHKWYFVAFSHNKHFSASISSHLAVPAKNLFFSLTWTRSALGPISKFESHAVRLQSRGAPHKISKAVRPEILFLPQCQEIQKCKISRFY